MIFHPRIIGFKKKNNFRGLFFLTRKIKFSKCAFQSLEIVSVLENIFSSFEVKKCVPPLPSPSQNECSLACHIKSSQAPQIHFSKNPKYS